MATLQKSALLVRKSGTDIIWVYPITTADNVIYADDQQLDEVIADILSRLGSVESGTITVDTSLSSTSVNPVQNKVIYAALGNKVDKVSGKGLSTEDFTTTLLNKLNGIASGAQKNQNAFSTVNADGTAVAATAASDTVNLVAGSNVSISADGKTITIAATNTTYGAAGTNLGLVKTGGDVTISNGLITVKDDSHNHTISNVDGLQSALDGKLGSTATAAAATKLVTARTFSITGGATASGVSFNGTGNVALNVTSLDASKLTGTVPISAIPAAALERLVTVDDLGAMYDLTTATVQVGDTVQVGEGGPMYRVVDTDNLDNAAGYREYTAGTASKVPWSGVTGKPGTFTPSEHTHNIADVSGLQSALNGKLSTSGTAAKATADASGQNIATTYIKSLSVSGKTITITKGNGSTSTIQTQDTNTTYSAFKGATSSAAGGTGLVPAPATGYQSRYLRGDATWATISLGTFGVTATAAELNFMDGVTSNVQTQLNAKLASGSANYVKTISINGKTITVTKGDNTTFTLTTQDTNTTYGTGNTTTLGLTKLYTSTGTGTDGTMTRTAITNALNGKLSTSGTAAAATKLATARTISLGGDVTGSASFNGTTNVTITATVKDKWQLVDEEPTDVSADGFYMVIQ